MQYISLYVYGFVGYVISHESAFVLILIISSSGSKALFGLPLFERHCTPIDTIAPMAQNG